MASTRRPNLAIDPKQLTRQIEIQREQLQNSLNQYKQKFGEYPLKMINPIEEEKQKYEFVNSPAHYQQEDGKETWERMVEKWGEEKTALWCEMTAFKYEDRMGKKPGEDIEREKGKIEWYKNKAEELRAVAKKKRFF